MSFIISISGFERSTEAPAIFHHRKMDSFLTVGHMPSKMYRCNVNVFSGEHVYATCAVAVREVQLVDVGLKLLHPTIRGKVKLNQTLFST